MTDQDLSDEQVKQLLKDAEQRLRNKAKQRLSISTSSLKSRYVFKLLASRKSLTDLDLFSLPKIAVENSIKPYIIASENGPQVDRSHLVTQEQRRQANGIRIVEDPIAIKKRAEEVRVLFFDSPSANNLL